MILFKSSSAYVLVGKWICRHTGPNILSSYCFSFVIGVALIYSPALAQRYIWDHLILYKILIVFNAFHNISFSWLIILLPRY